MSRSGAWASIAARLLLGWVVLPVVACTAAYWLTRWVLEARGSDSPHASGWAWIVTAVVGFCVLGTGPGSAFVRTGELHRRAETGRTWGDHEGRG